MPASVRETKSANEMGERQKKKIIIIGGII